MMKYKTMLIVGIAVCFLVAICGCNNEKIQLSEDTINKQKTEQSDSSYSFSDEMEHSDSEIVPSKEAASETEVESSSIDSSEPDTSYGLKGKGVDEMESGFIRCCENNGIKYTLTEESDSRRYNCTDPLMVMTKYSDIALAEKAYKEIQDYGGWYEEDLVIKEVIVDEDNMKLMAYYCQTDDKLSMLFVLSFKDTLFFNMEGIGETQVKTVEKILQSMGIDLNS